MNQLDYEKAVHIKQMINRLEKLRKEEDVENILCGLGPDDLTQVSEFIDQLLCHRITSLEWEFGNL